MARATRSTVNHEKSLDTPRTKNIIATPAVLPSPAISPPQITKKRKRTLGLDNDDQPASKLARSDDSDVPDSPETSPAFQIAGDVPIDSTHAQKILDILEMTDTQGLLDRVFPLPTDLSSTYSSQASHSLRSLLKHSPQHPLWVLRASVQHLFPLSSHPRSRPSITAAQQLRFCTLALSLFDQASFHAIHVPLSLESILPPAEDDTSTPPTRSLNKPIDAPAVLPERRYALMQHLPTGDYWSSLNIDPATPDSTTTALKDLPTAHAELVAIIPSPSSSATTTSGKPIPTLGSYHTTKFGKKSMTQQRRVTAGAFLDYGVWASFAPTFDHDCEIVGRRELGQIAWQWEARKRERLERGRERVEGRGRIIEVEDNENRAIAVDEVKEMRNMGKERDLNLDIALEELLPPDQVTAIKAALGSLELENAVQELLDRNRKALERLEELQVMRLYAEDSGSSTVEEGSEEWDTAQGIVDSLAVLASLRPRTLSTSADSGSIVPSPSVLHKLHRTLALEPSTGWYGTLPPTRATALRDDSTLKIRSGPAALGTLTPAPITSANTTAIAPVTVTPPITIAPAPTSMPYSGFTYAYGGTPQTLQQQPYRPAAATGTSAPAPAYTTYKPYYQQYTTSVQGSAQQQSYFTPQTYAAGASGQQPYAAFSSWYPQYPVAAPAATTVATGGGGGSGTGTPQPQSTTYGSFFSGVVSQGTTDAPPPAGRTPAVANTVLAATQPTWSAAGVYTQPQAQAQGQQGAVPTLPIHLRGMQQQQQQAYQAAAAAGHTAYYGAYQQQSTPAAR